MKRVTEVVRDSLAPGQEPAYGDHLPECANCRTPPLQTPEPDTSSQQRNELINLPSKQFYGKWKYSKRTGCMIWKWKRRKVKQAPVNIPQPH